MDAKWHDLADLEGEIWASCSEFDGYYEVSNLGRIKSLGRMVYRGNDTYWHKERILKAAVKKKNNACKYYFIHVSIEGKKYTREVHRLVAKEFVSGDNSLMVAHKNHQTLDNRAENLKFVSCSDKAIQQWKHNVSPLKGIVGGDAHHAKPITAFTLEGEKIKSFTSRIEAADWLIKEGIARKQPRSHIISAINKAAKGKTNSSYNHKWKDGQQ